MLNAQNQAFFRLTSFLSTRSNSFFFYKHKIYVLSIKADKDRFKIRFSGKKKSHDKPVK